MVFRRRYLTLSLSLVVLLLAIVYQGYASTSQLRTGQERVIVKEVALIGQAQILAGTQFEETEVGGLSGLTYDPERDVYYVVSDDRGERGPARFYTMSIDLTGNDLQSGDVSILGVTPLRDGNDQLFPLGDIDPEAIAYAGEDRLYIASEGIVRTAQSVDPFVNAFSLDGGQIESLAIPPKFLPGGASLGVRNNLAFESLTLRPDGRYLYTATENAIVQDGPVAGLEQPSLSRILAFDRATGQAAHEWAYTTEPVQNAPNPADGETINGLVELLALDNNGSFLALERSYSEGVGFSVRLYSVRTQGALEVQSLDTLVGQPSGLPLVIEPPVSKELLLNLTDLGFLFDNVEGMAFGPQLADGRQSLILVSDNNFNPFLGSRFIALALDLVIIPAARPRLETVPFLNIPATREVTTGVASDPAIWLHPDDPDRSLVIAAAQEGGLRVMDLAGQIEQSIVAEGNDEARFQQVDLLYRFPVAGQKVDLVVAADSLNDTLAVWRVEPAARRLVRVTSDQMPRPIFGSGAGTAERLAAYQSPVTGRSSVFVTQGQSNRVVQLMLKDDGVGKITADIVRTIDLPAGSRPGGLVADRLLGYLYVSLSDDDRILKYDAEPDGRSGFATITLEDGTSLSGTDGLAIYYGPGDAGYLLVSSKTDQSLAVLSRDDRHETIGRFIVAENDDLDQVNDPIGIDAFNGSLGPGFPLGMAVIQDSANAPQDLVLEPDQARNSSSNFKFVPWEQIAGLFADLLLIDTGTFNPRYPVRNLMPLVIAPPSAIE